MDKFDRDWGFEVLRTNEEMLDDEERRKRAQENLDKIVKIAKSQGFEYVHGRFVKMDRIVNLTKSMEVKK
jgi:polysaccharide deacetylase 2 family uncharacterized protein YibQ